MPGKPGQFQPGSTVKVWYIGNDTTGPLHSSQGVVESCSKQVYTVKCTNGETLFNVPYYVVSYPNEVRHWEDFFKSGQRAILYESIHVVLLNVDVDRKTRDVTCHVQRTDDGTVIMDIKPESLRFDDAAFI